MAQLFTNNAYGSLASAITSAATQITLVAGQGAKFPTPTGGDYFLLTLVGLDANAVESSWEIVKCTARASDVLTVVRAQESTTAVAWIAGTRAELRVTAGTLGGKQDVLVSGTTLKTVNGSSLLGSGGVTVPTPPAGGTVNQVLYKISLTDYDAGWKTLGTAADKNTGTAGNTIPLLDGANTWSGIQTYSAAIKSSVAGTTDMLQSVLSGAMEVRGDATNQAFVTFHRQGVFAANFGLDTNNKLKYGGYSAGAVTLWGVSSTGNMEVAKSIHFSGGQVSAGNTGTALTVNFANGQKQTCTLTGNATITLSAPGAGHYQLILVQDATGNRTVTWAGGTIMYVGSATAPAINTAANTSTVVSIYFDGTNLWLAASKVNA